MKNIYLIFISIILTVLFNVTGCSSGGGDAPQPLAYVGKADSADITLTTAPVLLVNVLYGSSAASDIPLPTGVQASASDPQSGNAVIARDYITTLLQYSLDNTVVSAISSYYIPYGVDINETVNCDSGSFILQGAVDDVTTAGVVTVRYDNCVMEGVTYNGSGTLTINYIDIYTFSINADFDFVMLTVSGPDFSGAMSGSMSVDLNNYGNQSISTIVLNVVTRDDVVDKMYKFENYNVQVEISDIYFGGSSTERVNGKVYDSIHGALTLETIMPLLFSSYTNENPDSGGPVVFTGKDAKMRLTVESNKHVLLEFDLDNNGVYELVRYVLWQEFDDYASIDLADTDGDGMHNSWEVLFALDPDVDDAGDDADFDGYDNLLEYQGGSNPMLSSSTPLAP